MRISMKGLLLLLLSLFVGSLFFIPKPPLLEENSFSQAVYDEQHALLRLTLSSDEKYRLYTLLSEISPYLIEATLLQEDQYYYYHLGINPLAIVKAAWQTYLFGTRQYGASTITMQVVRLRDKMQTTTTRGKLWQMLNALQLELFYSKEKILEAYLNLAPYGGNIEGIGAASLIYFSKTASQLTLAEALSLSVIPQNPKRRLLSSTDQEHRHQAFLRLCQRWTELYHNDHELQNHFTLPAQGSKKNLPFHAPHFVTSVLQEECQPQVMTSLNLPLQTLMEKMITHDLQKSKVLGIHNAAAMLVDTRTMEIKALVGSGNYFHAEICGQVDGTKAKRSPGSSLKPFIYALALDQGIIHPYTVLKDTSCSFNGYNPENFDQDFMGPLKAKEALILSRNVPAVHLASQLKNPDFHQFLEHGGIKGLKPAAEYGLSLALGSAEVTMQELVSLYAMLANGGLWQPLKKNAEPVGEGIRLLSPEASFLALDMLKETPRPLGFPSSENQPAVYWKTGTSSGYRDAWSVGIFGPYVLAVWIGNFNGKGNHSFVGATAAAPLFFHLIEALSSRLGPLPNIVQCTPDMNLTKVNVCEASGLLPNPHCPHIVATWFIPGKSPITIDTIHREIVIDNLTGLRTSKIDSTTHFDVYEFWPPDCAKLFVQAGVRLRPPPTFGPGESRLNNQGDPPQILMPQTGRIYSFRMNQTNPEIHFRALAEADVQTLYWFVDRDFVRSSAPDTIVKWEMKSGRHTLRCVDDHGRVSSQRLEVEGIP